MSGREDTNKLEPWNTAGVHEDGLKHTSVLVASDLRVWVSPRSWALVTELGTHTCFLNFLFGLYTVSV